MGKKEQQEEFLRHYANLRRRNLLDDSNSAPPSCKRCPFYRPEFKYRFCMYNRCAFGKDVDVFRQKPHRTDPFGSGNNPSGCEVVKMRV